MSYERTRRIYKGAEKIRYDFGNRVAVVIINRKQAGKEYQQMETIEYMPGWGKDEIIRHITTLGFQKCEE